MHMNGRVYDYNLGRFLSVDPFIHEGSQGLNPYSYILNNPLAGTDPTGYKPEIEQQTIKVKSAGSRLTSNVKVTVNREGGTVTVNLEGGSKAAQSAVANAVKGIVTAAGGSGASIGGQSGIAKSKAVASGPSSINKQNSVDFDKVDELANQHEGTPEPTLDGDGAANALSASKGGGGRAGTTSGSNPFQTFINFRYNQIFKQIQVVNPSFSVARPSRPLNRADIRFLEAQLGGIRGGFSIGFNPRGQGAASGPVPSNYVRVFRYINARELGMWISTQGASIPRDVGRGTNRVYVAPWGGSPARPRGATGDIVINFYVPQSSLNRASVGSQIMQPANNIPIYNFQATFAVD